MRQQQSWSSLMALRSDCDEQQPQGQHKVIFAGDEPLHAAPVNC